MRLITPGDLAALVLSLVIAEAAPLLGTNAPCATADIYAAGPICTAAELQLDACISNFLIQEVYPFRAPETYEIVDRAPEREIRNGLLPISDRPGLGIGLVEERARPFLWARCR